MNRREFALGVCAALPLAGHALAAPAQIRVFKSPTCGCCSAWVDHLVQNGFNVETQDVSQDTLWSIKTRAGITPELGSCHTGFVDGYFVEGHVPASDVRRLLAERPDGLGLTVPGMPIGSPGMEMGHQREAYDVLLVSRDGTTAVFSSQG